MRRFQTKFKILSSSFRSRQTLLRPVNLQASLLSWTLLGTLLFCGCPSKRHGLDTHHHRESMTTLWAVEGGPLEINAESAESTRLLAHIEPLKAEVEAQANRVIGTLAVDLPQPDRDQAQSLMGRWAVETMHAFANTVTASPLDLCITNNGGLRRALDAGPISAGMVMELMPFDNTLVTFRVSGAEVKKALARAWRKHEPVSGVETHAESLEQEAVFKIRGSELVDDQPYQVCTTNYLLDGGGGFDFSKAQNVVNTGTYIRDIFIADFEDKKRLGEAVTPKLSDDFFIATTTKESSERGES